MSRAELEALHAWATSNTPFRRRARRQQTDWRIAHGYPEGFAHGNCRGDRLAMPWAQESLAKRQHWQDSRR